MARQRLSKLKLAHKALLFLTIVDLCFPVGGFAWGTNAQRLIVNHAVDTLPYELRPFFEANRNFLIEHVNDPLLQLDKHPNERQNAVIDRDMTRRMIADDKIGVFLGLGHASVCLTTSAFAALVRPVITPW